MAITVSNTVTAKQSSSLPQFKGFWTVTATLAFASVTNSTFDSGTITVSGIELGDHIISHSLNADPEETIFIYGLSITADDTVTLTVYNESASPDTPAPTEIKLLIGRPRW